MVFQRSGRGWLAVVTLSGWVLWHDVGVYRTAASTRLAGPTYAASTYETEVDCEIGRREALANAELPRRSPMTELLPDGFMVWDPDRQHYTTFRYRCAPAAVKSAPFH
jgi:hypothetical protein